jgi:hypothetical protein
VFYDGNTVTQEYHLTGGALICVLLICVVIFGTVSKYSPLGNILDAGVSHMCSAVHEVDIFDLRVNEKSPFPFLNVLSVWFTKTRIRNRVVNKRVRNQRSPALEGSLIVIYRPIRKIFV